MCEREKIRLKQENWKSEQIEQTAMSPCVPVVAMRGWNLNLCTYAIQLNWRTHALHVPDKSIEFVK